MTFELIQFWLAHLIGLPQTSWLGSAGALGPEMRLLEGQGPLNLDQWLQRILWPGLVSAAESRQHAFHLLKVLAWWQVLLLRRYLQIIRCLKLFRWWNWGDLGIDWTDCRSALVWLSPLSSLWYNLRSAPHLLLAYRRRGPRPSTHTLDHAWKILQTAHCYAWLWQGFSSEAWSCLCVSLDHACRGSPLLLWARCTRSSSVCSLASIELLCGQSVVHQVHQACLTQFAEPARIEREVQLHLILSKSPDYQHWRWVVQAEPNTVWFLYRINRSLYLQQERLAPLTSVSTEESEWPQRYARTP